MEITRDAVLRYRVHAQQLDRGRGTDAAVLDLGVQDTGPDGAAWALRLRGMTPHLDELVYAWTLRGAPHAYRRPEAAKVAAAVAPFSEADAAKRVFDASTPLKKADIAVLDALDVVAGHMRDVVRSPTLKGDMSAALSTRVDEPYLRYCRSCDATHLYEQPFRLAALRAGLELEPGTSPPVLHRIAGWRGPAKTVPDHLDPVRAYLHLFGPATPKQVAAYLDGTLKDVKERWPADVTDVVVDGEARSALDADAKALEKPADVGGTVRLLGPFDPFLQCRDRELVIPDAAHRKDVWRTLGRPGAVLHGHEVAGTWRPKSAGTKLRVVLDLWSRVPTTALTQQAELLARHRSVTFDGFVDRE